MLTSLFVALTYFPIAHMASSIFLAFPKTLTVGSMTEPETHISTENSLAMGRAMEAQFPGIIRFFT